jgi:hypothetical protein
MDGLSDEVGHRYLPLDIGALLSAHENQVFPLDDGTGLLQVLRRPDEKAFHRELKILPGTPTLERYRSQKLVALHDFEIEAEVVHGRDDQGVLVAHGDQGGGYSLYVEDGVLTFGYNQYGVMRFIRGHASRPELTASCSAPRPALDSRGTSSSWSTARWWVRSRAPRC